MTLHSMVSPKARAVKQPASTKGAAVPAAKTQSQKDKESTEARRNVRNRVDGLIQEEVASAKEPTLATPSAGSSMEQFLDLPLLETLSRINAQVGSLQKQLSKVDTQVGAALNPPSAEGDVEKQRSQGEDLAAAVAEDAEKSATFLTAVNHTEEPKRVRKMSTMSAVSKQSQVTKVEDLLFEGAGSEPQELPGNLKANDVIHRLTKQWSFSRQSDQHVWEKVLSSDQAQNLLKDLFWWCFCEKFQKMDLSSDQESMFSRMAANFVRLVTRVPHAQKDKFFDRFYDIISQGVFIAYRVTLPDSEGSFDEKFRREIARIFAYWTTGGDIGPDAYTLPSGEKVKSDAGAAQVQAVVQDLIAEREELDEIVGDKKKGLRGTQQSSDGGTKKFDKNRKKGETPKRDDKWKTKSPFKGSTKGAYFPSSPNAAGQDGTVPASPETYTKGARHQQPPLSTRSNNASSSARNRPDEKLPVIPPLRLPPRKDTEQRTPRLIWTAKTPGRDGESARSAAPTARAHSARELMSKDPSARRSSSASSVPSAPLSDRTTRVPVPPPYPRNKQEEESKRQRYFDVKGTSPFLRYYLLTQVSTTLLGPATWKKMSSDQTLKAWDKRPDDEEDKRPKRTRDGERETIEEEEAIKTREEQVARLLRSAKQVSEQAVKKNSRIVKEYYRRSQQRNRTIGEERRKRQDYAKVQRVEMRHIASSQEQSHVFSNLLVSSGGGVNFETLWRKHAAEQTNVK